MFAVNTRKSDPEILNIESPSTVSPAPTTAPLSPSIPISVVTSPEHQKNETIKSEPMPPTKPVQNLTPSLSGEKVLQGKIICVDAGHGLSSYNIQEKIAPNSNETKPAFVSGTRGKNFTEEQINLKVALILQKKLEEAGAIVIMTRTTAKTDKTNIDRAKYANDNKADISVKLHCDGSENNSISGISMLIPGDKYIADKDVLDKSRAAGKIVLDEVIQSTNAKNRGLVERDDLTGFNWTTVPIFLIEMGFMTNQNEDALLSSSDYQEKIADGIVSGLIKYFE